jgi:hypothetical protein
MKEWFVKVYERFLTMFGDVKVFKYPMFILYNPKGYLMQGEDVRQVLSTVQHGDILVRGYLNYLDSYFIPGFFSHAGIYVGKNKVVHALAEGVIIEDVLHFCRCDYMAVIRPSGVTLQERTTAVKRTENCIGKEYDFFFDFENPNQLCCTELAHYAWKFKEGLVDVKPVEKSMFFGLIKKTILLADDYFFAENLASVYMSPYAKENFGRSFRT